MSDGQLKPDAVRSATSRATLGVPGAEDLADEVRDALRRWAKGVVVITARRDATRFAMAATAAMPLSLEPPSVIACVNQTASIAEALEPGAFVGFNLLRTNHLDLSRNCSGAVKGEARFATGDWREGAHGVPALADASAAFICKIAKVTTHGSHRVIMADVVEVRLGPQGDPLVYVDGDYVGVGAFGDARRPLR